MSRDRGRSKESPFAGYSNAREKLYNDITFKYPNFTYLNIIDKTLFLFHIVAPFICKKNYVISFSKDSREEKLRLRKPLFLMILRHDHYDHFVKTVVLLIQMNPTILCNLL